MTRKKYLTFQLILCRKSCLQKEQIFANLKHIFKTTYHIKYHKRKFYTFLISRPIHIYKDVQSHVIILNQHVSATLVTIIRVS